MKKISQAITQEESEQMTGMFNYSDGKEDVMSVSLRAFKQFNKNDKHYHTVYEVTSLHWINNKWSNIRGNGPTVIEAMGNYSQELSARGLV